MCVCVGGGGGGGGAGAITFLLISKMSFKVGWGSIINIHIQ